MVILGVACTGIAYILYFRLVNRAGPAKALTVTFLIPVFALIYGVVFLGETVTLSMLFLGSVVVFGTALSSGLFPKK
jgi:drug/metabolite transporter (DMT)-like permease